MAEDISNKDWYALFKDLDTVELWGIFHSELLCLIDKYVPTNNFSSAKGHSHPAWLNREVSKAIKAKHKAWNRYHFTHQTADYQTYSKARNHCTSLAKLSFEEILSYSISTNPKKFWSYVNHILRVKPGIPIYAATEGW